MLKHSASAVSHARTSTPFSRTLADHMRAWRRRWDGSDYHTFSSWSDGLFPELRRAAMDAVEAEQIRLHEYAAALRSSQVFAFNLFLPFRESGRDVIASSLSRHLGTSISIQRIGLEWVPPGALLGEVDGDYPGEAEAVTSVDVVLWSRLASGAPAVVLLEVKLSEDGFSVCRGRTSKANRRQEVCASASKFFADPTQCYLQRPVRKIRERRYWSIFGQTPGGVHASFPGSDLDGPCPFAGHAQQPMRNLAIARGLEQNGSVERAWFGLCAHDENPDVTAHWEAWRSLLPEPSMAPTFPASAVLAAGRDAGFGRWASWMSERYRLGVTT